MGKSSEMPLYQEQQSAVGLYWAIYAGMILFGLSPLYAGYAAFKDVIPVVIALALFPLVIWGFGRMNVVITAAELRFGYAFWRKRIPLAQVEVGAIDRISFWYGAGLHRIRGTWVVNAKLGRGLRVSFGGKRYLIGSDQPESLQNALLQAKSQKANR